MRIGYIQWVLGTYYKWELLEKSYVYHRKIGTKMDALGDEYHYNNNGKKNNR